MTRSLFHVPVWLIDWLRKKVSHFYAYRIIQTNRLIDWLVNIPIFFTFFMLNGYFLHFSYFFFVFLLIVLFFCLISRKSPLLFHTNATLSQWPTRPSTGPIRRRYPMTWGRYAVLNGVRWIHDYQDACVDKLERFLRGDLNINMKTAANSTGATVQSPGGHPPSVNSSSVSYHGSAFWPDEKSLSLSLFLSTTAPSASFLFFQSYAVTSARQLHQCQPEWLGCLIKWKK